MLEKDTQIEPHAPEVYEGELNILTDQLKAIRIALTKTHGNVRRASVLLDVPEKSLYTHVHKHQLVDFVNNLRNPYRNGTRP